VLHNWERAFTLLCKHNNQEAAKQSHLLAHSRSFNKANLDTLKAQSGGGGEDEGVGSGGAEAGDEDEVDPVELQELETKFEETLRAVSVLSTTLSDLSLAHSLSHVQTVESIEDLAARVSISEDAEGMARVSSADLVFAPASAARGNVSREHSPDRHVFQVAKSPVIRRQFMLVSPDPHANLRLDLPPHTPDFPRDLPRESTEVQRPATLENVSQNMPDRRGTGTLSGSLDSPRFA